MARRKIDDATWDLIKAEWIAGLLSLREISRQFGVDHKLVSRKALTAGWPPRNEVSDVVQSLVPSNVPTSNESPQVGTNNRLVLQSFDRVLFLIRAHRKDLGYLHSAVIANLQRVGAIVDAELAKGKKLNLKNELMISQILSSSANAMARLVPLERRAFGLSNEEISEFDSFTNEQLEWLANSIRKALG
jgi:hypothetical protein